MNTEDQAVIVHFDRASIDPQLLFSLEIALEAAIRKGESRSE